MQTVNLLLPHPICMFVYIYIHIYIHTYICVTIFSFSTYLSMDTGCFHILLLWYCFNEHRNTTSSSRDWLHSFEYIPRIGTAGVVLFSIFWGNSIPFFIMAVPIYILRNSVQGLPFGTATVIFWFLIIAILTGVRWQLIVISIYSFWELVMFTFSHAHWPLHVFLGKISM